jgi:uncharacterized protein
MDLKRRLGELAPPRPRTPAVACVPQDRAELLAELRQKMAALIAETPQVRRPPADPSAGLLPFVAEQVSGRELYRRSVTFLSSHHVGRTPVDAALRAQAELISLLALDARLAQRDFRRALFLDTETSGLGAGAGVLAFLVGLAWFDADGRLELEQLLLRRPCDEPALLERVALRVEACDVIVTFNGKSFDMPLLGTRAVMNRMPALPARPHLDLLHVARRLHRPRLQSFRLSALESDVLGFVRGPDIEGGEVPARYAHFLRTGDEEALLAVVEHNAWDVVSMAALLGLYGEPFGLLSADDLVGLAHTFKRARALERAAEAANVAIERGAGPHARRVRGAIAKARGDRALALADFETLLEEVDAPDVRLELAKLYEHYVKEPLRALSLVERGTGETETLLVKRRVRLESKLRRKS